MTESTLMPIFWMALECFRGRYTLASDVVSDISLPRYFTCQELQWAFGVCLWEIFSRGEVPRLGSDERAHVESLQAGNRLRRPAFCPQQVLVFISASFRDNKYLVGCSYSEVM